MARPAEPLDPHEAQALLAPDLARNQRAAIWPGVEFLDSIEHTDELAGSTSAKGSGDTIKQRMTDLSVRWEGQ